jgi:hypothetical protein
MVVLAVTSWVLMLFPATPKLGPIYQPITHYVPLDFPLLLVVPALAIDLAWERIRGWSTWRAAPVLGAVFLAALVIAQWPYATFVLSHGRNWFFHLDNFVYWQELGSEHWRYEFRQPWPGEPPQVLQYALALLYATISSGVGLAWGRWMGRVRR